MRRRSGDSQNEYLWWPFGPRPLVTCKGNICAAQPSGDWCSRGWGEQRVCCDHTGAFIALNPGTRWGALSEHEVNLKASP